VANAASRAQRPAADPYGDGRVIAAFATMLPATVREDE
jgi:hypothetical protein